MVTSTVAKKVEKKTSKTGKPASKVMFVNWAVDLPTCESYDLLAGDDYSKCNILFLDPLEFAVTHGLRNNITDLSETEYFPFDEREFGRYLVGIKQASAGMMALLKRGGLLVLRSQIPNSHIKVSKRTSAGSGTYTESLLSAFFWLEEILGKYSFKSCHLRAIRYLAKNDPVAKVFDKAAIDCIQTQNVITRGRREIIGAGGPYFKDPVVSRVTSLDWPGLIYLVPKFSVKDETTLLITAFTQAHERHRLNPDRPKWIDQYESQLNDLCPFRPEIVSLETQMDVLKKQLAGLQHKHEDLMQVTNMLHRESDNMEISIEIGLEKVGFKTHVLSGVADGMVWVAMGKENDGDKLIFGAVSSDEGPIESSQVENFAQIVAQQKSKSPTKGVLIGNADRGKPPEKRTEWFDFEALELARQADICLMPSAEFFTIITYLMNKADSKNLDDLKSSIRREIMACDSQFELSRKKYGL